MARALSTHGFQTTVEREPTLPMVMARPYPGSVMVTGAVVSR